jgi:YteA family regulatory protein
MDKGSEKMLSPDKIEHFRQQLLNEKQQLTQQYERDRLNMFTVNERENVGELSSYDNHPADLATELYEREKDMALQDHAEGEIGKIEAALQAIENGEYGRCQVCGKAIPLERLEAIPSTLYCVDHSPEQQPATDRPVEEQVLEPPTKNSFRHLRYKEVKDTEDSFQESARYGTSETPADFVGDFENYGHLYQGDEWDREGFTEQLEFFIGTDIYGKNRKVYPNKVHEAYEQVLDKEWQDQDWDE